MSLKSIAIKVATKKAKKTKVGKIALNTAKVGGLVIGTSLAALLLATEGKRINENKNPEQ